MRKLLKIFLYLFVVVALSAAVVGGGGIYLLLEYGRDLPDYEQLADYAPPTTTRVHAGDGRLIAEFAREKRVFVPISAYPRHVVQAFLAAEDKNFYQHPGVDVVGIARAALTNLRSLGGEKRPVGGSTITQQVAKNFLLTNEVSVTRKIKEAILAFRIERAISKDRILELYLNEIYLGARSYGVPAAALNYFNKSLDELSLSEAAYLAALPKAPNNYNPARHHQAAVARRNWVIDRMLENGFATAAEAAAAKAEDLVAHDPDETRFVRAPSFAEEVRRELYERYGETTLYEGGLSVRTTLAPALQEIALRTLREGLIVYDRRHGWRGPIAHIEASDDGAAQLAAVERDPGLGEWRLALVKGLTEKTAEIVFADGSGGVVPFNEMTWARPWRKDQRVGAKPKKPGDVVEIGDVIAVEAIPDAEPQSYALRQVPDVNGAIVALDPHTGRVLAMVGGYSYDESQFNRAVQAWRQPGSAFKPFVYTAALESGFTPASLILDAPFVIDQGPGLGKWKPANYSNKFYGPSTLRLGVEKSRNLMTVRLAQHIGMDRVADYAERFGVVDELPRTLAMALGSAETTLLRLTAGYAMLVNGGKRIVPTLIDRVQDRRGHTIFRHDARVCADCQVAAWQHQREPILPDDRPQLVAPATAYQMVSILQGVIERGTGRRISAVGKPLGGKTGTTNDSFDTWFIGFAPDLAVGVFVGFDTPRTLGPRETGSSVAAPIFKAFMEEALAGKPGVPFRIPPGIRLVRVNAKTGQLARPGEKDVIFEAFKPGTEPNGEQQVLDGSSNLADADQTPSAGTGGLY